MKVEVKKAVNKGYWYYPYIGQTFDAKRLRPNGVFLIRDTEWNRNTLPNHMLYSVQDEALGFLPEDVEMTLEDNEDGFHLLPELPTEEEPLSIP
jgi:hypothetical protein